MVDSSPKILHQDISFAQTFVPDYSLGKKKVPFWQQPAKNLLSHASSTPVYIAIIYENML